MDTTKSGSFLSPSDFKSDFPSLAAVEPDPVKELGQAELETVFEDWRAENYECLVEALPVDVLGLRLALNAAFAKACNPDLVGSSAS